MPTRTTNGRNATSNVSAVALERPSYKTSAREWNDEKKEADEPSSGEDLMAEVLKVTPPSVKDRASVFGGANKPKPKLNRNILRSSHDAQYAAQFAVREKPPKVDIYGNANRAAEGEEQREYDTGRGSSAAAALVVEPNRGAEHPLQLKGSNRKYEPNSPTSYRSPKSSGNVASAFLAARQNPKPPQEQIARCKHSVTVPMEDISASSDPGGGARKPAWQERNRVSAYGAGMNNNIRKNSNVTPEDIEKMIDERMQVQFQNMESRMEASLQRWMHTMDEKMMARLDVMEERINGIYDSLEYMEMSP
jgi:hypothetical protein